MGELKRSCLWEWPRVCQCGLGPLTHFYIVGSMLAGSQLFASSFVTRASLPHSVLLKDTGGTCHFSLPSLSGSRLSNHLPSTPKIKNPQRTHRASSPTTPATLRSPENLQRPTRCPHPASPGDNGAPVLLPVFSRPGHFLPLIDTLWGAVILYKLFSTWLWLR